LLERIVFAIDAALRRWYSIVEFTSDPSCVLRIRVGRLERPLVLADGTCGAAGERFVDLHLWNEQILAMPEEGASIAWVRQMHLSFQQSLQQLVRYLATRADLADIAVVRCTLMFAAPAVPAGSIARAWCVHIEPQTGVMAGLVTASRVNPTCGT
jgi:hypothetical protein